MIQSYSMNVGRMHVLYAAIVQTRDRGRRRKRDVPCLPVSLFSLPAGRVLRARDWELLDRTATSVWILPPAPPFLPGPVSCNCTAPCWLEAGPCSVVSRVSVTERHASGGDLDLLRERAEQCVGVGETHARSDRPPSSVTEP